MSIEYRVSTLKKAGFRSLGHETPGREIFLCSNHGGGPRCQYVDGCGKGAIGSSEY